MTPGTKADKGFRVPTVSTSPGAAFLHPAEGEGGWSHPPLYLPRPVLILRVTPTDTRVETPDGRIVAMSSDRLFTPFRWIEEILALLAPPEGGSERRAFLRPAFPLAAVAAAFEFGRTFTPHERCFPHAPDLEGDEFQAAFHTTGFVRADGRWKRVGRPADPGVEWKGWRPDDRDCDWPPPPEMGPDASTSRSRPPAVEAAHEAPRPAMDSAAHAAAVARIHEHLAAGDIYQANLTVRFDGVLSTTAEMIFGEGLARGGDRYSALVRAEGCTHISFSPELLVRRWGRSIQTKPIKGTRQRLLDAEAPGRELLASAKDRAEHVMIVDLERNDLGRICEYGSVRVDPLMELTRHPTLVHLESTVHGILEPRAGLREIFAALFPGGSVTGAPKRRALEIIGGIENRPRGIYCGALGWVDARGDCEFNLPIRTATLFDDGRVHLHAGGGIVADSNPAEEWAELNAKLAFLADAVRVASMAPGR